MQKQIEDASKTLNDSLFVRHKISGKYPKQFICEQVENWYEESNQSIEYVTNVISYIENKKYYSTALSHLSKISGLKKTEIISSISRENNLSFTTDDSNTTTNPYKDVLKYLSAFLMIFTYWYLLLWHTNFDFGIKVLLFMFGPAPLMWLIGKIVRVNFFD